MSENKVTRHETNAPEQDSYSVFATIVSGAFMFFLIGMFLLVVERNEVPDNTPKGRNGVNSSGHIETGSGHRDLTGNEAVVCRQSRKC